MPFADSGKRTVLTGLGPMVVTVAEAVVEGGLVGYSSGWKPADGNPAIAAIGVAAKSRAAGEEATIYQWAVVNGFTGATPGAALYLSNTAGYYSDTAGTYTQVVGRMLSDTVAMICPVGISTTVGTIEDGTLSFAKLAALASAKILVGSADNVAAPVAVTGDVTISNAGVTAIGTGKVLTAMQSTAAKLRTIRTSTLDIDTIGAATYDEVAIVPSQGMEIAEVRIVYDKETSGTVAGGSYSVGTSAVTGTEIVNAQALENAKAVGYAKVCTLASGTVAKDTPVFVRFTGVAATQAGATHLEIDFYYTDPAVG